MNQFRVDARNMPPNQSSKKKRTSVGKLNPVSPRLLRLATLLRRSASISYRRAFGLANGEWRLIGLLGEHGPMLQNELVYTLGQDKAQTSRAVAELVDAELITRERTGSGMLIDLSSKGKSIFESMSKLILARNTRLLAGLDKKEREALLRALDRLTENARVLLDLELRTTEGGTP
jgi:DNA-binding MarR family transcriptional regulator